MTIQEAISIQDWNNTNIYIPTNKITEDEFDRLKLIPWNDLNISTFNNIENTPFSVFSTFEKRMIKGFLLVFMDGFKTHEEQIMVKIGIDGDTSLGDFKLASKSFTSNSKIDANDYHTYAFWFLAMSFIRRTRFTNNLSESIYQNRSNQHIGNF